LSGVFRLLKDEGKGGVKGKRWLGGAVTEVKFDDVDGVDTFSCENA